MKRLASLFVLLCFSAGAATNLASIALQLDDKTVMELTAGLRQYDAPPNLVGKLTSVGSGTTTILINRWASEFAELHPEVLLNIQSGGSVDGLAKFLAGQNDLVPMSRALPAADVARFKSKFGYEPSEIVVSQDAIGVYVNKDNPITSLTLAQLEAIYSRTPKTAGPLPEFWRDLGVSGPLADERIVRVSLNQVQGTYMFFKEEVLHGADYRFDVQFLAVNSSLVQAAGADPAAVACASVMFGTERTRFVPLQAADGTFVLPSYQNTVNGRYPLTRPMRIVFNRKPDGTMNPAAREFLRFAVSRRGQRIIALDDSYPLTLEQQTEALRVIGDNPPPKRRTTAD